VLLEAITSSASGYALGRFRTRSEPPSEAGRSTRIESGRRPAPAPPPRLADSSRPGHAFVIAAQAPDVVRVLPRSRECLVKPEIRGVHVQRTLELDRAAQAGDRYAFPSMLIKLVGLSKRGQLLEISRCTSVRGTRDLDWCQSAWTAASRRGLAADGSSGGAGRRRSSPFSSSYSPIERIGGE
jgi:hypothetical protein